MPTVDGAFAVMVAIVLGGVLIACVVGDLVVVFLVLRRTISPDAALIAGAVSLLPFVLLIAAGRDALFSGLVAALSLPVAAGLVTVCVALYASTRSAMPRTAIGRRAPVALAGIGAMVYVVAMWGSARQREALDVAIRSDDVAAARSLLDGGAASDARDAARRQALLVQSARHASPDLVNALLDVGADPNGADTTGADTTGDSPLLAAIGSKPMWRMTGEPDPVTHARNRYRTVEILLDGGADPSGTSRDPVTPAEMAWGGVPGRGLWPNEWSGHGDEDILRLLKARGARDADRVSARFEELMEAAAAGNVERLRTVLGECRRKPEVDATHRSPMVAAAENGHLAAVEVLLATYGGYVHCDLVEKARKAAATRDHAAVVARLVSVCAAAR